MSEITARSHPSRGALVALLFVLVAVALYIAAGAVDDGLYLWAGIAGLIAAIAGARARRGPGRRVALAAMVVGGLFAAAVFVFTVIWGIGQLV